MWVRRFAAHESFTPATELASCYRTGSMFLSSLIMSKIKLCDFPNLSFLLAYDLILCLLPAVMYSISSTYPQTLHRALMRH